MGFTFSKPKGKKGEETRSHGPMGHPGLGISKGAVQTGGWHKGGLAIV